MISSGHVDTFARDNLPPPQQWPEFVFDLPELQFAERLNCAAELLDKAVARGFGERPCVFGEGVAWTYAQLLAQANRVARVLVGELGLRTGQRVLLRGGNSPMLAACWFGVVKAGGIAVGSMPLLRAKELTQIVTKAQVSHALCDARLADELAKARADCPSLTQVLHFQDVTDAGLEARMAAQPGDDFAAADTALDDVCLIAFTSGTTGQPKGTMHFHRDVMASCLCWPPHVLRATADDRFIGSPPLAFTFGLGGLLVAVVAPLALGFGSPRDGREFGCGPEGCRRLDVELGSVELERRQVLRLERRGLVVGRDEFGVVVEIAPQHLLAELAISAAEQQVLVPDLVDHARRCHRKVRDHAQIHELLVLTDRTQREPPAPVQLPHQLVGERLGRRVRPAERGAQRVEQMRRCKVVEVIAPETQPEVLFGAPVRGGGLRHGSHLFCGSAPRYPQRRA